MSDASKRNPIVPNPGGIEAAHRVAEAVQNTSRIASAPLRAHQELLDRLSAIAASLPQIDQGTLDRLATMAASLPQIDQGTLDRLSTMAASLPPIDQGTLDRLSAVVASVPQIDQGMLDRLGDVGGRLKSLRFAKTPGGEQALPRTAYPPAPESVAAIGSAAQLGGLVRAARIARGLPQQALADLVGVGRRFLSELENGKPTVELDKALKVAAAVGLDLLARKR